MLVELLSGAGVILGPDGPFSEFLQVLGGYVVPERVVESNKR